MIWTLELDSAERRGKVQLLFGFLIECVPGHQHGHDDRLAGASGHLHRQPMQQRVGGLISFSQIIINPGVPVLGRDLSDIDQRFEGFNLAEEQPTFPTRQLPVRQQFPRHRRNVRIFLCPPFRDFHANRVDRRVLLFRFLFQIAEECLARFSRLGNRYPVTARSSPFGNSVREAIAIESVMVARFEKRRIQDRVFNREWQHVSPASERQFRVEVRLCESEPNNASEIVLT